MGILILLVLNLGGILMDTNYIKNIEFSKALEMEQLIEYQSGKVVSLNIPLELSI